MDAVTVEGQRGIAKKQGFGRQHAPVRIPRQKVERRLAGPRRRQRRVGGGFVAVDDRLDFADARLVPDTGLMFDLDEGQPAARSRFLRYSRYPGRTRNDFAGIQWRPEPDLASRPHAPGLRHRRHEARVPGLSPGMPVDRQIGGGRVGQSETPVETLRNRAVGGRFAIEGRQPSRQSGGRDFVLADFAPSDPLLPLAHSRLVILPPPEGRTAAGPHH